MTIDHYDPKFIDNNPWQTRAREPDADYIQELAQDIQKNGLLQVPIGRIIQANGAAKVQLAFGHNRLKAYLHLKLPLMPVDVRELTDEQLAAFAWSENEKRRDITAIERAKAIQQRITDFKWTNRQAADALGVDHSTVSNLLRLLKLPEELQTANMEGKLSERQIQAILPLFEMPEENRKLIESRNYYYNSSARIIQDALQGHSSDYLRNEVDNYFNAVSQDLGKAEFKLDEMFTEGEKIYCGLCKTCDRRMASRNRCFDMTCFEAKTNAVRRLYLASASIKSGYDLVDETKGGYPTKLPSGSWNKDRDRILATKCPNLRLIYTGDHSDDIEGYPHARLVCDKRNNSCTCIKGLEILKNQDKLSTTIVASEGTVEEMVEAEPGGEIGSDERESIELEHAVVTSGELEEAARQARREKMAMEKQREEIEKKLVKHLYRMLEMLHPGAFYIAINYSSYYHAEDLNLIKIFRSMAIDAARHIMPNSADSTNQMMGMINETMKRLELEPFSLEEPKPVSIQTVEEKVPIL